MIKLIIGRTLIAAASIVGITTAFGNAITGPSSSESPYLLHATPGVVTFSVFTVGDSVNFKPAGVTPYRMVGIADGLGAYDNGDGTFTVVMNHEIGGSISGEMITPLGGIRAHGNAGAFVSRWTINKDTLEVFEVQDFLPNATSIFLSNNDPSASTPHTATIPAAPPSFSGCARRTWRRPPPTPGLTPAPESSTAPTLASSRPARSPAASPPRLAAAAISGWRLGSTSAASGT
jgi:hypothetical protein